MSTVLCLGESHGLLDKLRHRCNEEHHRLLVASEFERVTVPIDSIDVLMVIPPLADEEAGIASLGRMADHHSACWRLLATRDTSPTHLVRAVNHGSVEAILPWPCPLETLIGHLHHGLDRCRQRRDGTTSDRLERAEVIIRSLRQQVAQLEEHGTLPHLMGGLAHELNNPLGAILGHSQRLPRSAGNTDDLRRRAGIIAGETQRCIDLVARLRAYATPRSEAIAICDPGELARQAAETVRTQHRRCPRLTGDQQLDRVLGGPRSLQQVFEQLFDNARLAGAQCCRLSSQRHEDRVVIHVDNDGETPGDEILANATKPFFTCRSDEGHQGLGLSLANALAREIGGSLTMQSHPSGTGARCCITLDAPNEHDTALFKDRHGTGLGKRVLLIDDEPMIAELLGDMLATVGCSVDTCDSIAAARQRYQPELHDLVICDQRLPDGCGGDLLHALVEGHPQLRGHVAFSTGDSSDPQLRQQAQRLRAPIIGKPFRMADLQQVLSEIL